MRLLHQTNRIDAPSRSKFLARVILVLLFSISLFASLMMTPNNGDIYRAHAFQSNLPDEKPDWWISNENGGTILFSGNRVIIPPWYTTQSGAAVFVDLVTDSGLRKVQEILPGTEFALGIWPNEKQTIFDQPIEIRVQLNAALFPAGGEEDILFMMFDPALETWRALDSEFDPATYEMVAFSRSFTPMPDEFPDWGGRTFFGLFRADASEGAPLATVAGEPSATSPTVNRSANLRAGPGIQFPVTGSKLAGDEVSPISVSRDRNWLLLDDENWIAAFLVENVPDLPVTTSIVEPNSNTVSVPQSTDVETSDEQPEAPVTARLAAFRNVAVGTQSMSAGSTIDLDTGRIDEIDGVDIIVLQLSEDSWLLASVGDSATAFGRTRTSYPTLEECSREALGNSLVIFDDLTEESSICVRTDNGNLSLVAISLDPRTEDSVARVRFSTWELTE